MRSIWDGLQKSLTHAVLVGTITSILTGCGGGGVGTTTGSGTITPGAVTKTAAAVQMLVGSSQLKSDGSQKIATRIIVTDTDGIVIPTKTVTLSVVDTSTTGKVFLDTLSSSTYQTDANGQFTANLNLGKDNTNRTVQIRATVDSQVASQKIDIIGTSINISGSSAMVSGSSSDYKINVVDAGGKPITDATVVFTSSLGNTVTPKTPVTDSTGQATFTLSAITSGTESITASALGASATQAISISSSNFNFISSSSYVQQADSIDVNTSKMVAVQWLENNVPQANKEIDFSLTRGSFLLPLTGKAITDTNGIATATFQSSQVGAAKIIATGVVSSGQAPSNSLSISYITQTASSIVLQADKTTLPVNSSGSETFQSRVTATVRDSNNNLVQNATIAFNLESDGSGGKLSSGSAVTDGNGQANVFYIAGTHSSAQNGVHISAIVQKVGSTAPNPVVTTDPSQTLSNHELQLTVGGQAKYVRIGTDNKVAVDGVKRIVNWSAVITDSSGGPVSGQSVQFILRPAYFTKGSLTWDGTTYTFTNSPTPLSCPQEDTNLNGSMDTGEDINGNGNLTPGNVATVASSSAASDTVGNSITITSGSTGFADAYVIYPASSAYWVTVTLQAKISVDGTESSDSSTFSLPGQLTDYQTQASPPPGGLNSPYGHTDLSNAGCANQTDNH